MSEAITKIILENYYSPSTGFQSANKLFQKLKPKYHDLKLKQVQNVINQQPTQQIHQQHKIKLNDYNQINAYGFSEVAMDLLDLSTFKSENENYRDLLLVQDLYSRFFFAEPLKSKDAKTVLLAVKKIQYGFRPCGIYTPFVSITADEGSEFNNRAFKEYFRRGRTSEVLGLNTKLFFKNPELKNSALAITDRLCRTIRDILRKFMTTTGNHNWIDRINRIVNNINSTYHETIHAIPSDVYNGIDTNNQEIRPSPPQLRPGQKVRLRNLNKNFNRKHQSNFSNRVYEIENLDGLGYKLLGQNRKYFYHELKLVPENSIDIHSNTNNIIRRNRISRILQKELH